MEYVEVEVRDSIATVTLSRGKVNALDADVIAQIDSAFRSLAANSDVNATILTGRGKFFSFGFDVPEIRSFSRHQFARFFHQFTDLYTYLFTYPKPLIAAINGHAVAGGCMLALACDRRIMADGNGKISLNEITFGSAVFAGSVEMLRFAAGGAAATQVLYSGAMYSADEASRFGLVERSPEAELRGRAEAAARELASRRPLAFATIKHMLRAPVAEEMVKREQQSIDAMVELWSSEPTRTNLLSIQIR